MLASGVGSMVGGLIFGHLAEPADPARRLATLMFVLAVTEVPLALAPDLVSMGIAVAIAGAMLAPAFSLAFRLLSEVAPAGTVTEAQTWVATGISAGIASGSALGGWIVEHVGTRPAFWVPVAAGLVAATIVAARLATLRQTAPAAVAPVPA